MTMRYTQRFMVCEKAIVADNGQDVCALRSLN